MHAISSCFWVVIKYKGWTFLPYNFDHCFCFRSVAMSLSVVTFRRLHFPLTFSVNTLCITSHIWNWQISHIFKLLAADYIYFCSICCLFGLAAASGYCMLSSIFVNFSVNTFVTSETLDYVV